MNFFFSLFLLGRKQRRKICGGENSGVAKDGLIRFRWLREPKGGQVLFTKTMRVISQLYKGPIVQDNEIMISSHLRLPIGKELHSHWKATIRARGQNPSKGRALRCAAQHWFLGRPLLPELSGHAHQSQQVWLPLAPEELAGC